MKQMQAAPQAQSTRMDSHMLSLSVWGWPLLREVRFAQTEAEMAYRTHPDKAIRAPLIFCHCFLADIACDS